LANTFPVKAYLIRPILIRISYSSPLLRSSQMPYREGLLLILIFFRLVKDLFEYKYQTPPKYLIKSIKKSQMQLHLRLKGELNII